jgi:hypothetical protein
MPQTTPQNAEQKRGSREQKSSPMRLNAAKAPGVASSNSRPRRKYDKSEPLCKKRARRSRRREEPMDAADT